MKFLKKPVVIEAWQVTPDDGQAHELPPLWILNELWADGRIKMVSNGGCDIHTPEGVMRAEVGDWIIQGAKGELYPCKPEIFDHTYEPAERTATHPKEDRNEDA